ncbi:MAG: ATP-binding protein, partial [Deltaproteobacteria bacterium]
KRLREINEASHRCKRIVENLLTFARFHKPEKKHCNINNIITTAVELRAYQLKVGDIKVELNLAPSLPKTLADEHQLQQVLLNLINNAEHSIAEKGVKGKITISTEGKDKNIIIKVSDTGKGIPDDIISNIFNPFFTTKQVGKGTGLGLSISYGIIKEHGGNITANSRHGEGASFIIELPIIEKHDDEELTPSESEAPQQHLAGEGLRALVLDDEPPILTLLNEVLSDAGFRVDTAGRVEDALKLLKKTRYNLIISDIKMPGMDGKEFYRKVKAMNPKAARDIIFLSGDSASKETQDFFKETGNPFLHKPFTIEKFKKIISKRSS